MVDVVVGDLPERCVGVWQSHELSRVEEVDEGFLNIPFDSGLRTRVAPVSTAKSRCLGADCRYQEGALDRVQRRIPPSASTATSIIWRI